MTARVLDRARRRWPSECVVVKIRPLSPALFRERHPWTNRGWAP
ncbi:hypothetical protein CLV43_114276 [Umezawaea tangerina]|uniref:Uncharacterized protein n=1 Tax=Umezawaea tangerina TaxID=84725 RepID=A0A2T0SPM3_9PSEU|nr:hypothetical protein CLV43_114276 [Umezawaea tangerina]